MPTSPPEQGGSDGVWGTQLINWILEQITALGGPRGELGSCQVYTDASTASSSGIFVDGSVLPVDIGARPVKVTVSCTLKATAATLVGIQVYEDANIIGFLHWQPTGSGDQYTAISKSFRRNPAPGPHAYQVLLANYFSAGVASFYMIDPTNIPLEIIVEEI